MRLHLAEMRALHL